MEGIKEVSGLDKKVRQEKCGHRVLLSMRGRDVRAYTSNMDVKCLDCGERFVVSRKKLKLMARDSKVIYNEEASGHVNDKDFYQPYFMAHHYIYPRIKNLYDTIKERIKSIECNGLDTDFDAADLLGEVFQNIEVGNIGVKTIFSKDFETLALAYIDERLSSQKGKTMQKHM